MSCSLPLYALILRWIEALGVAPHAGGAPALAHLVTALLRGQSLRPTSLMRSLLSPPAVLARQRYRRVARLLAAPWLRPAWLTPHLVRATLALFAPAAPVLALDTVRCGAWELFTVGLVVHDRCLPLAWAVLP